MQQMRMKVNKQVNLNQESTQALVMGIGLQVNQKHKREPLELEEAMDLLKSRRAGFISMARKAAVQIASKHPDRLVTIDDVRDKCPPPEGIDPRVMGAVFSERDTWEFVSFTRSARRACHHRPIQIFRLKSDYIPH